MIALLFLGSCGCLNKGGKSSEFMEETIPGIAPRPAREDLSHALDSRAESINPTPRDTTIEVIVGQERPADLADDCSSPQYQDKRIAPFETTVWRVVAALIRVVLRPDGDIYLVLQDSEGRQIVAEAPPIIATEKSHLSQELADVFSRLQKEFLPNVNPKTIHRPIVVEGVGFFGKASKREGAPHNGARLMPILNYKFK